MSEIENLHIKELRIDNYKSLKHTSIELQSGLNIIIGKNGAGKSNLLEFIYEYAIINSTNLYDWSYKISANNFSASFEYTKKNIINTFSYSLERNRYREHNENLRANYYEMIFNKSEGHVFSIKDLIFEGLIEQFGSFIITNSSLLDEINMFSRFMTSAITYNIPEPDLIYWVTHPTKLTIEGGEVNIMQKSSLQFFEIIRFGLRFELLNTFSINSGYKIEIIKQKIFDFIEKYINSSGINESLTSYTTIKSIRLSTNINIYKKADEIIVENLYIEFLIEEDWLPWYQLSDGTKRLFYLISECIALDNGIILIEEPELGIHPHQFYKVLDFLQEQAQTKQVIISTHSPMALDILKPDELDRITIAKYDKGTKFLKLDEAQKEKAKRYMEEVGELSYYWLHSDLEND